MEAKITIDEDLVRDALEVSGDSNLDDLVTRCLKTYLLLKLRKQLVIRKFRGAFNRKPGQRDNPPAGNPREAIRAVK